MTGTLRAKLRDLRYALPGRIGGRLPAPGPVAALRICARLHRQGFDTTLGYFQADDAAPEDIVVAYRAVATRLRASAGDVYLSIKAPPLAFAAAPTDAIAALGHSLLFDAHAPRDAAATHALAEQVRADHPATGLALPARWRRSAYDARALRDTAARLRVVKGEWPDEVGNDEAGDGDAVDGKDTTSRYLALIAQLAGRSGPVAVATHDPALAEAALRLLRRAGTPCELEQLRGLPRRRTVAVARRLGVPVRIYVPFGPGWWPYAINQALARPYLPLWALRDALAIRD